MKLLLDENLSYKLKTRLSDLVEAVVHVADFKLAGKADEDIWPYAKQAGLTILTRDYDFVRLSERRGQPPKVIWINLKNPSNADIETCIRKQIDQIDLFITASNDAVLFITAS